jgi:hypothetical protein
LKRKRKKKKTSPKSPQGQPTGPHSSPLTLCPHHTRSRLQRSLKNQFTRRVGLWEHSLSKPQITGLLPINDPKGITWPVALIWMGCGVHVSWYCRAAQDCGSIGVLNERGLKLLELGSHNSFFLPSVAFIYFFGKFLIMIG